MKTYNDYLNSGNGKSKYETLIIAKFELMGHTIEIYKIINLYDQYDRHTEWFVDGKYATHFGYEKKYKDSYIRQFLSFNII